MSGRSLFGSSFSMSNEVNFLGKKTEVRCKGKSWPQLTKGEVNEPVNAASFLPAVLGAIPLSLSAQPVSTPVMAALGAISAAGTILVTKNQESGQFSADYILSLMKVMNGAYAKNGNLNAEELKRLMMLLVNQMLKKAGPGFTEWKQVLMNLMQNATMDQFLKGVQSAVCAMTGDPVNANTGNFIYEKEDILIKGRVPLCFKRSYNRIDEREGCMGKGWRHNYEIQLLIERDSYIILWEDGREEIYLREEDDSATPLFGCLCRLKMKEGHFYYETQEGITYIFNKQGQLIEQKDINGQGLKFVYNQYERLDRVSNGFGSYLVYEYDRSTGRLIKVKDHTGRTIELTYDLGRLVKVTNGEGNNYWYSYDSEKTLYRIRNPRGTFVLENSYDDKGRTVKQEFADGGTILYDYQEDSSRTLVTQQNGSKVSYVHDEKFRNIKTVYEDGDEKFSYNDRNQLTMRVDKNGNKTKFAYDNKGNLSQIIFPDGCKHNMTYDVNNRLMALSVNGETKIKNTYDTKGNLLHTEDALGREQKFIYDTMGRVEEIIQADKSRISIAYDERSNISKITDGAGNITSYSYDTLNRVVKTIDGNGNRIGYEYDLCDRLTGVINAQGKRRSYEYTKNGKVTKVVDFNGATTYQDYNNMNQVSSVITPDGGKMLLEYDYMQNVTKRITPNGAEYLYEYDGLSRLEKVILPTGGTIQYEYDANGNRIATTDANGNKTTMEYDEQNRITEVVDANGARTEYDYDMEGNLTGITNAMGQSITYTYDVAGQKVSETDIQGNVVKYEYNELGKISCVIDSKQRKTVYEYGLGGILERTVYPDGSYEQYTYDNNGNLIRRKNQKGDYIDFSYDSLNQLINMSSSFGQKKSYTYDEVGNVTSVTDVLGNVTKYEHSKGGNLIAVIDAMGNKTEYGYDAMDNLITVCQHEGSDTYLKSDELQKYSKELNTSKVHVTSYERNALGMIETITDPLGLKEHYTYDQAGQMIVKLDKEGYETHYDYTKTGELSGITYADERSVAFQYNPLRQLIEVKDWLGTTKMELDENGRTRKITDYKGREVCYKWGRFGERTGIVYPDGRKVSYEYDEFSRLSRLNHGEEEITYHYDEEGRLTEKQMPNGIISRYQYNAMGFLSCLAHESDGNVLEKYDYKYDLAGNKTQITKKRGILRPSEHVSEDICKNLKKENGVYSYRYDKLDRLAEVSKDGERLRCYEYDAFGNRIRKQEGRISGIYKYNAANQLLEISGTGDREKYEYDKRGNLIEIMKEGKRVHRYQYDATNRLSKVLNGKGQMALYDYCGLGYRIGKQEYMRKGSSSWRGNWEEIDYENEKTTAQIDYLIDVTKPYHNMLSKIETREDGLNKQEYIWDSNVVSVMEGTDSYTYLQDELGSPVRLLDIQENNQTVYGYDEFGQDLFGNQGDVQPFGYTGYQKDGVANTYFAQARDYQPKTGRFTSEDPIKYMSNWYAYCENSPITYIDPTGLETYIFYTHRKHADFLKQANWQKKQQEKQGEKVVMHEIENPEGFINDWNNMGIENGNNVDINNVYIYTHSNPTTLIFEHATSTNAMSISGKNSKNNKIACINQLNNKEILELNLMCCNSGNLLFFEHEHENLASAFSKKINDGLVYAYDGSIGFGRGKKIWESSGYYDRLSDKQTSFETIRNKYNEPTRQPLGKVVYFRGEYMPDTPNGCDAVV